MGCLLQGHVGTELYSVGFPVFPSCFFFFFMKMTYSIIPYFITQELIS